MSELWGIGNVTAGKLQEMGVVTLKDLAEHDVIDLISTFGKTRGIWLKQVAAGIDDSPVKERDGSEQIGRIATLPEDTLEINLISQLLNRLAGDVISKLDSRELSFKTVTITVINSTRPDPRPARGHPPWSGRHRACVTFRHGTPAGPAR